MTTGSESLAMEASIEDHSTKTSFPKNRIKILLLENVSQRAVDYLVQEGYTVETANILSDEELIEKITNAHVVGVRSKTKLKKHILEHAKRLLCIGCFCIGTDQTDLKVAASMGVPVFNSPFANTRSVAELIIAQIIGLSRRLGDQNRWMHQGLWKKTAKGCFEIRGKTLGIIGYGHVGSQVSVLAESMGMQVIYYDIIPKLPLGNARAKQSFLEVLTTCDYLTLHVPATPETQNMITEKEISLMKKGSYLLNAARGKCVQIEAVAKALRSQHLAGAYFDVYPNEPIDKTLCLIDCPNCLLTPHIGGSTLEAQRAIGLELAMKITRFINEGCTTGAVNFPEISLKPNHTSHRILHVHRNVPGVLRKINEITAEYNVTHQSLGTVDEIGYLLIELSSQKQLSQDIKKNLDALPETIRTRVLFSPGE